MKEYITINQNNLAIRLAPINNIKVGDLIGLRVEEIKDSLAILKIVKLK